MIAPMDLQARVEQYLTERRRLGFHLRSPGHALPNFARCVEASEHTGVLTVELMAQWARQAQGGKASAETAARRLAWLRPFLRWLQQFEPQTEVPDDSTFGPIPGRVAAPPPPPPDEPADYLDQYQRLTGKSLRDCPQCGKGQMVRIESFLPGTLPRGPPGVAP